MPDTYDPDEYTALLNERWPLEDDGSPLNTAWCPTCHAHTELELTEDAHFVGGNCVECDAVIAEDPPIDF